MSLNKSVIYCINALNALVIIITVTDFLIACMMINGDLFATDAVMMGCIIALDNISWLPLRSTN